MDSKICWGTLFSLYNEADSWERPKCLYNEWCIKLSLADWSFLDQECQQWSSARIGQAQSVLAMESSSRWAGSRCVCTSESWFVWDFAACWSSTWCLQQPVETEYHEYLIQQKDRRQSEYTSAFTAVNSDCHGHCAVNCPLCLDYSSDTLNFIHINYCTRIITDPCIMWTSI